MEFQSGFIVQGSEDESLSTLRKQIHSKTELFMSRHSQKKHRHGARNRERDRNADINGDPACLAALLQARRSVKRGLRKGTAGRRMSGTFKDPVNRPTFHNLFAVHNKLPVSLRMKEYNITVA